MRRYTVVLCLFLYIFTFPISAAPYGTAELKEYIPDDIIELIPEDVFSDDVEKSASAVSEISGFSYFLKYIFKTFGASFDLTLSSFLGVFAILTVGSCVRLFGRGNETFETVLSMCSASLVFGIQYKIIGAVRTYLGELSVLMGGVIPMMSALSAAGGNVSSAAVNANAMLIFLSVCERVCIDIILPIVKICYALSVAGIICKNVNISGITGLINKTAVFVLGFVSTLAAALLTYQNVLAQGADTTASKVMKFSLGALVPIVGGAIGDTVKTLFSGLVLIKNTLGVLGVVLIFLCVLPPLIRLFLNKLFLSFCSALSEFFSAGKKESFFADVSGIQNLLIAVCAFSSLMFLVALGAFMRTVPALGV